MSGRVRAVSLALAMSVAALGPVVPAGTASAAPHASWTVMVYMSGDNNLEGFVVKDLERELAAAGSTAQVQITALADRGPGHDTSRGNWTTTKLFHPTAGMVANAANAVADWGERNMGSARTLRDFVTWSKTAYPADHYALYFWGHGWGWHPDWTMADDSSGDGLDPDEIADVLPDLGFIDVIGYDACNMAQIEIMDLWHGHAAALAASQEWVGMVGIGYDVVLSTMNADPGISADEVAIATRASTHEATFSAVALDGRYATLRDAVARWSVALEHALPEQADAITRALRGTRRFWEAPTDKDLHHLAKRITARVSGAGLRAKGRAVMHAVDAAVLYRRFRGPSYRAAHGITITGMERPGQIRADWASYPSLRFARATAWDEFLDRLLT